jgi:hypothetical protein
MTAFRTGLELTMDGFDLILAIPALIALIMFNDVIITSLPFSFPFVFVFVLPMLFVLFAVDDVDVDDDDDTKTPTVYKPVASKDKVEEEAKETTVFIKGTD